MAEYINKKALRDALYEADAITMEGVKILNQFPSADVAPVVHGAWDWFDEDTGSPISGYEREWGWRCSNCKTELSDDFDKLNQVPQRQDVSRNLLRRINNSTRRYAEHENR